LLDFPLSLIGCRFADISPMLLMTPFRYFRFSPVCRCQPTLAADTRQRWPFASLAGDVCCRLFSPADDILPLR